MGDNKMNEIYACSNCGVSVTNRSDWCDLGCGSDYNEMIDIGGRRFIDYSINQKNKNKLDLINDILKELPELDEGIKRTEQPLTPDQIAYESGYSFCRTKIMDYKNKIIYQ